MFRCDGKFEKFGEIGKLNTTHKKKVNKKEKEHEPTPHPRRGEKRHVARPVHARDAAVLFLPPDRGTHTRSPTGRHAGRPGPTRPRRV